MRGTCTSNVFMPNNKWLNYNLKASPTSTSPPLIHYSPGKVPKPYSVSRSEVSSRTRALRQMLVLESVLLIVSSSIDQRSEMSCGITNSMEPIPITQHPKLRKQNLLGKHSRYFYNTSSFPRESNFLCNVIIIKTTKACMKDAQGLRNASYFT